MLSVQFPIGVTIEVDELKTHTQNKSNERWVVTAYCRETKKIIDYKFGRITTKTLQCVTGTLLFANPVKIYTSILSYS
ncbi:IS1 family transposase [Chryseobacterium ginsenosidimutans]|uniref:IS1 family transposase n=1 Tax=Chryseobacterium ginsenosidimutans TaxID=687846 RepID=UPI0035B5B616